MRFLMSWRAPGSLQTHTPLPLYGDHENKAVKNLIIKTKDFKSGWEIGDRGLRAA
jgi:hypothetical protein